jgi:tetratricopeptide (TPR) repeat protein
VTLFIFLINARTVWAENSASASTLAQSSNKKSSHQKVETIREVMDKAQELAQGKDRSGALNLLYAALKKENKTAAVYKELQRLAETIAYAFYLDKTQQAYELALSLFSSNLKLTVMKLNEAASLEPDNAMIQIALVRAALRTEDCRSALEPLRKVQSLVPNSRAYTVLQGQVMICQNQYDKFWTLHAVAEAKATPSLEWSALESEVHFKSRKYEEAESAASVAIKLDPLYPESYYWKWKSKILRRISTDSSGQSYLQKCKSLSLREIRSYIWDPNLCRRQQEVEEWQKKAVLE